MSQCLGNRVWLSQLGWPGQNTQTGGEILYSYDPACIQGKKCSNGVYQKPNLNHVIHNHGDNNNNSK